MRDLRMDADAALQLPRTADLDGHLRDFDLLRTPRCRQIHRFMDARAIELGRGRDGVQSRHTRLLSHSYPWRNRSRRVPVAAFRHIYVGSLSHAQFARHKLLQEART